jgi:dynein heavy chain
VISPLSPEIYKMMVKLTRSIVDSTKQFHRWNNGTCILTLPQKVADDEEPVVFSFYSDILNNQQMVQTINQLNVTITKTFGGLNKWLDSWRKYRPLWKVDKVVTLEKFVQKKPTIVNYDEKLTFYSKLARDVEQQSAVKDVDFIRVIFSPLQAAIHSEATSWVASIGKHLNVLALEGVSEIETKLAKFDEHLMKKPGI